MRDQSKDRTSTANDVSVSVCVCSFFFLGSSYNSTVDDRTNDRTNNAGNYGLHSEYLLQCKHKSEIRKKLLFASLRHYHVYDIVWIENKSDFIYCVVLSMPEHRFRLTNLTCDAHMDVCVCVLARGRPIVCVNKVKSRSLVRSVDRARAPVLL